MVRPMLGDLDLEQVQMVETDEDQVTLHHPVPALDAGFLQRLGRRGALLRLTGVLTRPDTLATVTQLRERFLAASPVPFVSDISTATLVEQVLVEGMEIRELAGRPDRLEYSFTLREYLEAEPVTPEPVDIPPPEVPDVDSGALSVTVVVEGQPTFDFDRVTVEARGTEDEGARRLQRPLTTRVSDNVWLEDPFPAGTYTVEAVVPGEPDLTGSATTRVENGEVAQVRIVLRAGARIGFVSIIHFRFDSAFVEPCMRAVLRQVADRAAAHPDERLLLVGHTDLVGSDAYNQSLSERRSRATYAYLTYGRDPAAAVNEWNELRRARPAGVLPSARDTWGTHEYQHMLADLGYFRGNVDGDFDLTDAAVRRFQADNGLVDDGIVGDATWPVLIEAYLAQDALAVPEEQLLANAADGCDEGPLRWLGCNEQDPVLRTQDAWRPNRRTELMFVREAELPCPVPRPVTLDLVPDGAGGGGWCLDDGTASAVCCFVTPADQPCPDEPSGRWCRRPAEEGSFTIQGRVLFDDGTPVADTKYVLTAPDGEFMDGEVKVTSGAARAGTPIPGRTGPDGAFRYDRQKGPGIYTFELQGPFVVRLAGQPLTAARNNTACARLDGSGDLDVVATPRTAVSVVPDLAAPDAVVVRKPSADPARRPVTLRVSEPFTGTGTLTRSDDRVRLFPAAAGGTELAFDGVDNVFSDAQLAAGHTLFAEGARPSDAVDDVTLTLALTVGGAPGLTATQAMTAVEVTLDIAAAPDATGAESGDLPPGDKADPGRVLQEQTPDLQARRARLTIRPPRPADFGGTLSARPLNARVALFTSESPAPTDVALGEHTLPAGSIGPGGAELFCEGRSVSSAPRDTGVQLGVEGLEPDGDRVNITVAVIEMIRADNTALPLTGDDACHMVSKFVTDENLPAAATFDGPPGANPDPDTFRVQVRGLPAQPSPTATLTVTRAGTSMYTRDFPMLDGAVGGLPAFRSDQHVRLVSNAVDDAHLAHQTPRVRLDDRVRATVLAAGGQVGAVELPVGRPPGESGPKAIRTCDINFVTLDGVTSDPGGTVARMSENWAQLAIRFRLVGSQTVTPVENVLSVDLPGTGGSAAAGGTVSVDITPDGGAPTSVTANISAGDDEEAIAGKLAQAINAEADLSATHHRHADEFLVLVNRRAPVTFANTATSVPGLLFRVPALDFTDDITLLEGSVLGLNFNDDDPTTVDVIAVGNVPILGPTTLGATGGDFLAANLPGWHNLAIIRQSAADGTAAHVLVAGHEMGHALMDGGNDIHARAPFQLPTSPIDTNLFRPTATPDTIGGAKRLDAEQNERARDRSGPTTTPPILHAR